LSAYSLPAPYARSPLRRRASGLALTLLVNLGLLLVLMTLGVVPVPVAKRAPTIVVNLIPEAMRQSTAEHRTSQAEHQHARTMPTPKPSPLVLPSKPTISPPPKPPSKEPLFIEMSHDELAAADISNLPKSGSGEGDSEVVGRGPHGELLYAAEWAREPTDAELGGYLPRNAPDGWGLIACKTIPNNRVEDCVELGQDPPGSHLASAVRQAAWQFRVRPPRKNGRELIGSWVQIRIDYERIIG
jgi:protein TonB